MANSPTEQGSSVEENARRKIVSMLESDSPMNRDIKARAEAKGQTLAAYVNAAITKVVTEYVSAEPSKAKGKPDGD
jgi:hypothetical protein